jgi:hypothetical protein
MCSGLYFFAKFYHFPEAKPFAGDYIYNPYQDLPQLEIKANFHSHSKAWWGITNGHNTENEIFDAYQARDYQVIGISNYFKISPLGKLPAQFEIYEHGVNIFKSHVLAIEPERISYIDFPLYQHDNHQQTIIQNLKDANAIVVLAHPKFGGGRKLSDMRKLVNYDFTEVLNHYGVSEEHWDAALTAGRLSWIMGNDDTHDLEREPTFRLWNVIYTNSLEKNDVLGNLLLGKSYAVKTPNGLYENALIGCKLADNNLIQVAFEHQLESIMFIGANGQLLSAAENRNEATYAMQAEDAYVRVVAKANEYTVYLNPLLRFDNENIPYNTDLLLRQNNWQTWLNRFVCLLFFALFAWLLYKTIKA